MDATVPFAAAHARPALQILSTWLVDAWRMFRRAPVRLFLLSLLPVVVEALIQLAPGVGIVLSKLLTPLAGAWVLALIHHKSRDDAFAPALAGRLLLSRLAPLLLVSLLAAGVFVFQLLVTVALGGIDQAIALATGDIANLHLGRVVFACILASGTVPAALLMFVMPRVLLDGVGVGLALGESLGCVVRYWRPVALLTALVAAMVGAILWLLPLLLVLLPFATLVGYTSYRDVFDRARVD
ncbi:hypothetical protein [Novilysobacter erysipheiresistens]|uniref:DUF2189 domain-containing protein n=1 Tax=Novilysobacter erysipheiresistens TaxID=1749332 RepID=A0ABU7YZ97_9GAMM